MKERLTLALPKGRLLEPALAALHEIGVDGIDADSRRLIFTEPGRGLRCLFLKPADASYEWTHTDLWNTASALPDVTVVADDDGAEARRFGVSTSGQTLLYDERGRLLFAGGITGSRAHQGDNDGRRAIVALLNQKSSPRSTTSVFGCALFARDAQQETR